ncbi:MAG: flagellar export chaperone FliS [Actinomycetota bacterium]|nr:flagellar export chaperone FliS [Actinomycetota bacterium]
MSTYQRAAAFRSSEAVVSPVRLLVMLYDRLIRDLDDAADSIRTGDRPSASFALVHAQEIVTELETALDPDAWDAAAELSSIYVYLQARLVRANLHQDLQAIHDCRVATDPLREAWTKIWQDEAAKVVRPVAQSEGHLAFDAVG